MNGIKSVPTNKTWTAEEILKDSIEFVDYMCDGLAGRNRLSVCMALLTLSKQVQDMNPVEWEQARRRLELVGEAPR